MIYHGKPLGNAEFGIRSSESVNIPHSTLRIPHSKGQAIIEYLMVVAAVIAAILAVRGLLESRATALMTNAVNRLPTNL